MNKITRYEQLFFTKDAPLSHNVLWLEKRLGTDALDQNAFNLYFHNNGEWRNILQQVWDNRDAIALISASIDDMATMTWVNNQKFATQTWVNNQGFLTEHQSLDDYATKTWVGDQGYLTNIKVNNTLGTVTDHIAEVTIDVPGGEPDAYVKSGSCSGNKCTMTDKTDATSTGYYVPQVTTFPTNIANYPAVEYIGTDTNYLYGGLYKSSKAKVTITYNQLDQDTDILIATKIKQLVPGAIRDSYLPSSPFTLEFTTDGAATTFKQQLALFVAQLGVPALDFIIANTSIAWTPVYSFNEGYLPLAGGTMDSEAYIYFTDEDAFIQRDSEGFHIEDEDEDIILNGDSVKIYAYDGVVEIINREGDASTDGETPYAKFVDSKFECDMIIPLGITNGFAQVGTSSDPFHSMYASGGFYETSDIRKKDIKGELSLEKAYELIEKCSTVVYTLKGEDKEQIGLIAQEVEEFFPEIVSTGEDGFKSLDYSRLTVILLKVIKDIIDRLNKLEK